MKKKRILILMQAELSLQMHQYAIFIIHTRTIRLNYVHTINLLSRPSDRSSGRCWWFMYYHGHQL